jgi:hypothetical protein
VWLVDVTTHQREVVLRRERLPHRIVNIRASIAIGARHENDHGADCGIGLRAPESELGYGVIAARPGRFIQRGAVGHGRNGKDKGKRGNLQVRSVHFDIIGTPLTS